MLPDYENLNIGSENLYDMFNLVDSISFSNDEGTDNIDVASLFDALLEHIVDTAGKNSAQLYTPQCVARLLVKMLAPEGEKRLYDGCCGIGTMFIQSEEFIKAHEGHSAKMFFYGQEMNPAVYRLAKMNLAIRGIKANLEPGDSLINDKFSVEMDYILANPPFNAKNNRIDIADPSKWKYGIPPTRNANYAWLQHFISKLTPAGRAGVILAPASLSTDVQAEYQIRKGLIEDDLVECIVILPAKLFAQTQHAPALWLIAQNKSSETLRDRRGEILFIDARDMGMMVNRRQRELTDTDMQKLVYTYHSWQGKTSQEQYADIPGFCKTVSIEQIRENNYILTPGRYIDFPTQLDEDDQSFEDRMQELTAKLKEQMNMGRELDEQIKTNLQKVGYSL